MKNKRTLFLGALLAIAAFTVVQAGQHAEIRDSDQDYQIGTSAAECVGFHGASPVAQRSGSAQAAVTQTSATVSTAAATDLTTTEALANALKTQGNAEQVDIAHLTTLVNELRAALVEKGIIKGGT